MNLQIDIQPVFILGCPRSGTTLMGNYLNSAAHLYGLGEFMSFFTINYYLKSIYSDERTSYRQNLVEFLTLQSHIYASKAAASIPSSRAYIDDTPLNLLTILGIEKINPSPIYVCMIRSIGGITKSLGRSFDNGFKWAGEDELARVNIWVTFYNNLQMLPPDRTHFVCYEDFILNPDDTILEMHKFFNKFNLDISDASKSIFTKNHASGNQHNSFVVNDGRIEPTASQMEAVNDDLIETKRLKIIYSDEIDKIYANFNAIGLNFKW